MKYHIFMRVMLTICAICIAIFINRPSYAQESDNWSSDKLRLYELDDKNKCKDLWDILWPWAKKGNQEARLLLLTAMMPGPDMKALYLPGNASDLVSSLRDIVIFSVHTRIPNNHYLKRTTLNFYHMFGFGETTRGRKFLECLQNTEDCSAIAVSERLVPSFEDYARQIDRLIEDGYKSTCLK